MKPADRDRAYLWDMLDAARRARRIVEGIDFEAFIGDERTSLAIERLLENIGEAANHVSPAAQERLPAIPWQGIVGIRNVLAHQYGAIDQARLWAVVSRQLPGLIRELEAAVE